MQAPIKQLAVIPRQIVNLQGQSQVLKLVTSDKVYNKLVEVKCRPPIGLRHWLEEFDLIESDIVVGFTHAKESSKSSFDHAFQYKIMT